jgi:hypothetical protein
MKTISGPCGVCQKPAEFRCTACFNIFYCGAEHQKAHWKEHKKSCKKPYILEENATCGRSVFIFVMFLTCSILELLFSTNTYPHHMDSTIQQPNNFIMD